MPGTFCDKQNQSCTPLRLPQFIIFQRPRNLSFSSDIAVSLSGRVEFVDIVMQIASGGHPNLLLMRCSLSSSFRAALIHERYWTLLPSMFNMDVNNQDEEMKMLAIMTLANIIGIDPARSSMVMSDSTILTKIICVLKRALNTDGSAWPLYISPLSFRSLSLVDVNRNALVKAQLIPLLFQALQGSLLKDDLCSAEYCISTCSSLAFSHYLMPCSKYRTTLALKYCQRPHLLGPAQDETHQTSNFN